eukprot:CAMPEP_0180195712 /NCGR_PEP_ID=MMETSP0987-20121128/3725_1 /TAXON_ID=697907 /ORGANISM="non described non described, Strain CCMP2293" /LENGTH=105 /DNA_ID=CAMNT_0022150555 /DNA_START=463 /DNA_END=777 /DNA_ORIENTATION=+
MSRAPAPSLAAALALAPWRCGGGECARVCDSSFRRGHAISVDPRMSSELLPLKRREMVFHAGASNTSCTLSCVCEASSTPAFADCIFRQDVPGRMAPAHKKNLKG